MSGSTLLLVLLAFAFGLWLGFDPEAHAAAEDAWQDFKTAVNDFANQSSTDEKSNSPDSPVIPNTGEDSTPNTPNENPESNKTVDQINAFLRDLWESIKTLWRDLMEQTSKKTAYDIPEPVKA